MKNIIINKNKQKYSAFYQILIQKNQYVKTFLQNLTFIVSTCVFLIDKKKPTRQILI